MIGSDSFVSHGCVCKAVAHENLSLPYTTTPQVTFFSFSKRRRRRRSCSTIKAFINSANPSLPQPPGYTFFIFEKEKEEEKLFIFRIHRPLPPPYTNPQFTRFPFSKTEKEKEEEKLHQNSTINMILCSSNRCVSGRAEPGLVPVFIMPKKSRDNETDQKAGSNSGSALPETHQ